MHHNPFGSMDGDAANRRVRYVDTLFVYRYVFDEDPSALFWEDTELLSNPSSASKLSQWVLDLKTNKKQNDSND